MSNKQLSVKISDRIISSIETQMAEGKLMQGDKLPSERKLATQYNASRATIREAIGLMEAKGMVQIRHGMSTIILDIFKPKLIDPLQDLVKTNQALTSDVIAVRHLLEVEATILAAKNATKIDLATIDAALNNLLNCDRLDAEAQVDTDIKFHLTIADASKNVVLANMMRSMGSLVKHEMLKTINVATQRPNSQSKLDMQHKQIYQAIQNADATQAQTAARAHLEFVQSHLN